MSKIGRGNVLKHKASILPADVSKPFATQRRNDADAKKIKKRKEVLFSNRKVSFYPFFASWRLERPEEAGVSTVL
jgi:hypothetical protein